ncbi:hypothetical protein CYMTET_34942 [Cymbomonas tetramitiformis]|uniref:Uncharacterized protein n=1 Tax=Cymbomonas tetramitiformis TaxID=36881 RepID=A0AAE0FA95_9CHLO|nr:hypothetical protein CYMTET_34942 [Cymbomonas tetramitiformis]
MTSPALLAGGGAATRCRVARCHDLPCASGRWGRCNALMVKLYVDLDFDVEDLKWKTVDSDIEVAQDDSYGAMQRLWEEQPEEGAAPAEVQENSSRGVYTEWREWQHSLEPLIFSRRTPPDRKVYEVLQAGIGGLQVREGTLASAAFDAVLRKRRKAPVPVVDVGGYCIGWVTEEACARSKQGAAVSEVMEPEAPPSVAKRR